MKLALIGNGRMGRMIESLCTEDSGFVVAGLMGPGDFDSVSELPEVQVAIDFSYPGNLMPLLQEAKSRRMPLVIGTTGLDAAQEQAIREAAQELPIVWANNFSTGVTVLTRLVRMASQALGEDFDIEITETHHRKKADAPSGTAKALLKAADPEGSHPVVYGREGRPGERGREIGMHALRGGTVAGEHSVHFFGNMEEIELKHRADSRQIFAAGALRAAKFVSEAAPGLYDMEDVLFGAE